jgi:hypothetical protein
MYGHAFLQIEVHSKKSRRLFSQTRNLQDKIRHGRSPFYRTAGCDRR